MARHAYVSMYDQQHAQASAILAAADTVARDGDRQLAGAVRARPGRPFVCEHDGDLYGGVGRVP
jgi:hypothetical protein